MISDDLSAAILAANFAAESTVYGRCGGPALKLALWTIAAVEGRIVRRADLADLAGLGVVTIDRAIRGLRRAGLVRVDQTPLGRVYWIERHNLADAVRRTGSVIRETVR